LKEFFISSLAGLEVGRDKSWQHETEGDLLTRENGWNSREKTRREGEKRLDKVTFRGGGERTQKRFHFRPWQEREGIGKRRQRPPDPCPKKRKYTKESRKSETETSSFKRTKKKNKSSEERKQKTPKNQPPLPGAGKEEKHGNKKACSCKKVHST